MRRIFYIISLILLIGIFPVHSDAQNRLLRYADKQKDLENFQHAAEIYEQAYSRNQKITTARNAAEAYSQIQEYDKSFTWWEKVITNPEAERSDYSNYLNAAMKVGKADQIGGMLKGSSFDESDFPELDFDLISSMSSKKVNVKLVQANGINSDGSDFGLQVDKIGSKFFSSDRGSVIPTNKKGIRLDAKSNLYSSEKSSFNDRSFFGIYKYDKDSILSKLVSDLPEALHISDPSLMESQNLVFYSVLRDVNKIKGSREFTLHSEIFYSIIGSDGTLSSSKPFPLNNFTEYGVLNPFVDEENQRIYFVSDMEGGVGGFDIYFVTYDGDLNFSEPVNLGKEINTPKNERYPSVNGSTLYFASNGHPGLGGMDIFKADISSSGFSNIQNMGLPYNSPRDDFGYIVTKDGKRYLSSDRVGGMGLDDIYLIEDLFKKLIARVIDCDDKIISESFNTALVNKEGGEMITSIRNEKGEILADLEPESNFNLKISKKGYFSIYDSTLSTIGLEDDVLEREYKLVKIPYNLPVMVDIVYYDLDKAKIRKDAEPVLNKIAELMTKYDFLDLAVASHTDSRASDKYNMLLSEKRAEAVKNYLSQFGIPENRVRIDWYGKEKLTNDCGDGIPCPELKHQLNRRSELVLEAFSDSNKEYDLPASLLGKDLCDENSLFEEIQNEMNSIPVVYFDFDKSTIRAVHEKDLEKVGLTMKKLKNLQLYIAGHTDQRGNEDYNLKLAERRAKAVLEYLVQRGVESNRIEFKWFGKSQPINDCGTVPCTENMHQLNRRTELHLKGNK
ncbi:OmpA family protein [Aquiflexum gelatinilyticum]|uniref:OmpA family protein n=1 Tax=Aquiflexum gelatinilyticum TaxID=2961943 RepID=UPI00216A5D5F|nr:OmpA family protein [Aquiflexum gelatinilyticum]MCS4435616.1 OmpA family protein [Aquiflexum gelatinilyticum]